MAEFNLEDWSRADLVFTLMAEEVEFDTCLKVARNCRTMEEAERFMNQECPICCATFFMDEVSMQFVVFHALACKFAFGYLLWHFI